MLTRSTIALALLAPVACVHVQALDFSQAEQAENDYEAALAALEEVALNLSRKPPNDDAQSQTAVALGLKGRADLAVKQMRAAYDRQDAAAFERSAGELRLVSQMIYTFAGQVKEQKHG